MQCAKSIFCLLFSLLASVCFGGDGEKEQVWNEETYALLQKGVCSPHGAIVAIHVTKKQRICAAKFKCEGDEPDYIRTASIRALSNGQCPPVEKWGEHLSDGSDEINILAKENEQRYSENLSAEATCWYADKVGASRFVSDDKSTNLHVCVGSIECSGEKADKMPPYVACPHVTPKSKLKEDYVVCPGVKTCWDTRYKWEKAKIAGEEEDTLAAKTPKKTSNNNLIVNRNRPVAATPASSQRRHTNTH